MAETDEYSKAAFSLTFSPYRGLGFIALLLLVPCDLYFLTSLVNFEAYQGILAAHPDILQRLVGGFAPFVAWGVVMHGLAFYGLLTRCTVSLKDGLLSRSYQPFPPHFSLEIPFEDVRSVRVRKRIHQTRRGATTNASLMISRRSGKELAFVSARPGVLNTILEGLDSVPEVEAEGPEERIFHLLIGWEKDPAPRTAFLLAEAYQEAGETARAAYWYHLRARLGGSTPEIFCARHRAASCWAELGWWRRALIGFLSAWEFQPQRLESVYELSWRLRSRSDYQTAFALTARTVGQPQPEEDYVQPWVYQYALLFEHSINAYWVGEFKISIEACDRLLAMADLPETYRLDTVANRRYSVDALENARVVGRHGRLRHLTDAPMSQVLGEADPGLTGRLARLSGLLPDAIEQQFYCEGPEVEFPLREFNTALRLRPGTSDVRVVDATFYGSPHLPPPELTGLELIFDLGANIGTTAIHFASLFPEARIIAVELDLENAELCRRNTRGWGDRVVVVRGAVAAEDGMLSYNSGHQPWGRRLEEGGTDLVEAMSLDTLLALYARDRMVDYLKLDIEGAEEAVLREGGDWVRRVRCLKVETHGGYSVQQAMEHLESHGFVCQPTADHWSCVVGVRPPD